MNLVLENIGELATCPPDYAQQGVPHVTRTILDRWFRPGL